MVFQNTQVTRGSATFVVTATGAATQMGRIADMVTATKRTKSPLQRELDGMTKVFGSWRGARSPSSPASGSLEARTARRSPCCASRPRSRRSPPGCRRSCRPCCRRARSGSPRRRRSSSRWPTSRRSAAPRSSTRTRPAPSTMNAMTVTSLYAGGPLVLASRGRVREDRRDPRRGRHRPPRFHAARARPVAVLGRDGGR